MLLSTKTILGHIFEVYVMMEQENGRKARDTLEPTWGSVAPPGLVRRQSGFPPELRERIGKACGLVDHVRLQP